jgi:hypothetical protein
MRLRRIRTGRRKTMQHSCRRFELGHTYKDNTRTNRMETAQQDRIHGDNSRIGSLGTTMGQDVLRQQQDRTGRMRTALGQVVFR